MMSASASAVRSPIARDSVEGLVQVVARVEIHPPGLEPRRQSQVRVHR